MNINLPKKDLSTYTNACIEGAIKGTINSAIELATTKLWNKNYYSPIQTAYTLFNTAGHCVIGMVKHYNDIETDSWTSTAIDLTTNFGTHQLATHLFTFTPDTINTIIQNIIHAYPGLAIKLQGGGVVLEIANAPPMPQALSQFAANLDLFNINFAGQAINPEWAMDAYQFFKKIHIPTGYNYNRLRYLLEPLTSIPEEEISRMGNVKTIQGVVQSIISTFATPQIQGFIPFPPSVSINNVNTSKVPPVIQIHTPLVESPSPIKELVSPDFKNDVIPTVATEETKLPPIENKHPETFNEKKEIPNSDFEKALGKTRGAAILILGGTGILYTGIKGFSKRSPIKPLIRIGLGVSSISAGILLKIYKS